MNHGLLIALLVSGILYGTPLVIAALGELLAEASGVMNLSVEGMMLMGAVTGFWVSERLGGPSWMALLLAIITAAVVGGLIASIHAFMTVTLRANQIVSGLALWIACGAVGLSSYIGQVANLSGAAGRHALTPMNVFGLQNAPIVGPILFHQNALVYFSWALTIAVSAYLYHTRAGLHVRAVGDEPAAADATGINVRRHRYLHTIAGGCLAGVAGASFSLAIAPSWTPGMTAGAGWIAIALVIFAFWRPGLVLAGAYLFGTVSSLGFTLQARGVHIPTELFSSLPYLMTIVVLVLASTVWSKRRLDAPKALGIPYSREGD